MPINKKLFYLFSFLTISGTFFIPGQNAQAAYRFSNFKGRPPIHSSNQGTAIPGGLSPDKIKQIYNLPANGGIGTIAIIDAYDSPNMENDLNIEDIFNLKFIDEAHPQKDHYWILWNTNFWKWEYG